MRTCAFIVMIALLAAPGCGSKYKVVPVSGTITLNGEPLPDVTILTQPVSKSAENNSPGPGSYGKTDADGRFTLELQNEPTPGAVPGKCVITVVEKAHSQDPSSDEVTRADRRTRIPPEFRENRVTYDIPPEGTDAMDINIDTKKKRR